MTQAETHPAAVDAKASGHSDAGEAASYGKITITNCHIHTFTADYVPDEFFPFGLTSLLRISAFRHQLALLGAIISPFLPDGRAQRFMQFLEVSNLKSQEEILQRVRGFYPLNTRFVVLPMDMEYMGAGKPPRTLHEQHQELFSLAVKYAPRVIPFCAVDPRRPDIVDHVKKWIDMGFCGIKLYPNLGYYPTDPVLMEIYGFAEQEDVPIMTHCSSGGIHPRGVSREQAAQYGHPEHYEQILEEFPKLRVCLAHFGGGAQWEEYRKRERHPGDQQTWLSIIADLTAKYPNLYTDISYTIFRFRENVPILKIFLTNEHVRKAVLFGSDYYMVELERMTEREVSIELRADLGETLYRQIAQINPERYLGQTCISRLSTAAS